MHFPLSLSFRSSIKGGKGEGEEVFGRNYSVNFPFENIINTVDVDYYSVGGSNHLKNLRVFIFRSNFHYSLPYHTLEVRITALV